MLKIRGFAVDVDGTITEDGSRISLEAAFSLRWLKRMGYEVLLASGRSAWETLSLAAYLGVTRVVVAENGGVVAHFPQDVTLLADRSESLKAYDLLSSKISSLKVRPTLPRLTDVVLERTFDRSEGLRIIDEAGLPIAINDSKYAYHLTRKGVDKGRGLETALRSLGLEAENVIAIGDSETDVPMFDVCGYSVALGNAPDWVKRRASYSVESGWGLGLVEAVQHVADHFLKIDLDRVLAGGL